MPKVGDVFMLDLGFEEKTRPVVIVSREDGRARRALSVFVPLTKESRGGKRGLGNIEHRTSKVGATAWQIDRPPRKIRRPHCGDDQRSHSLDAGSVILSICLSVIRCAGGPG
jgi:hypothetical protein